MQYLDWNRMAAYCVSKGFTKTLQAIFTLEDTLRASTDETRLSLQWCAKPERAGDCGHAQGSR